jgi:hypothetical protein
LSRCRVLAAQQKDRAGDQDDGGEDVGEVGEVAEEIDGVEDAELRQIDELITERYQGEEPEEEPGSE